MAMSFPLVPPTFGGTKIAGPPVRQVEPAPPPAPEEPAAGAGAEQDVIRAIASGSVLEGPDGAVIADFANVKPALRTLVQAAYDLCYGSEGHAPEPASPEAAPY